MPRLEAAGWWDAGRFEVAARLEEAWASGAIGADLERIDRFIQQVIPSDSF